MTRRNDIEPRQWRLPDGSVGTEAAVHGDQLVLLVSRSNWPFPKLMAVARADCERVKAAPLNTQAFEEARW